ncbi:MAG: hypothetical protein ACJ72N_05465 [Labedaea sp.]
MPNLISRLTITAGALGAALTLAGCQNTSTPAGLPVSATPPAGQETPAVPPSPEAPAPQVPTTPAAAAQQWVMPNLVGTNLQAAQDQIQALTGNPLFITFSHDATKQNRHQVLDSNWTVCSQNIPPGSSISSTSRIDFGAVKNGERCP